MNDFIHLLSNITTLLWLTYVSKKLSHKHNDAYNVKGLNHA
jgi:hypothetical protein